MYDLRSLPRLERNLTLPSGIEDSRLILSPGYIPLVFLCAVHFPFLSLSIYIVNVYPNKGCIVFDLSWRGSL